MEFTIHIDDGGAVATMRLTGPVTVTDLEKVIEQMATHPQYHEGMARLWDLRKAKLPRVTQDDMRRLGDISRAKTSIPGTRVAVLVAKDVDFGVTRMFMSTEGESLLASTNVFREAEAAEAWLRASDSDS